MPVRTSRAITLVIGVCAMNIGKPSMASQRLRRLQNPVSEGNPLVHEDYPELQELGTPATNPDNYPLDACQGGCFSNSHCRDDLLCDFRSGTEPVLGCSGVGVVGTNYCYRPHHTVSPTTRTATVQPTTQPTAASTVPPSTNPPTKLPTATPTPVPTTPPTPALTPQSSPTVSVSTTTIPPGIPDLVIVPGGGQKDKCQGSCQINSDCLPGLQCQERGGNEFVPGCRGEGVTGENYCFDPSDGPAPPAFPEGTFRLRLFWQLGYFWQESAEETFWCMQFTGEGAQPQIRTCRQSSTQFEFVYLEGEGDQIKVAGTNQCLDRTGNVAVTYQPCDETDSRQRWMGGWPARRFDLRPSGRGEGCLTNHHHPKSGEVTTIFDCETAHITDTGYWQLF